MNCLWQDQFGNLLQWVLLPSQLIFENRNLLLTLHLSAKEQGGEGDLDSEKEIIENKGGDGGKKGRGI